MKIRSLLKFNSPGEMSLAVMGDFVSYLQGVLEVKPYATVAISGGNSPLGFFSLIARQGNEELLPWERIHLFWVDERFTSPYCQESNFGGACEAFLQQLSLPEANIHPVNTDCVDPEAAAAAYREELFHFFGSSIPVFDLILLGMGNDGHIASLFPNSQALKEETLAVVATPPPQLVGPKLPRVTLTLPVINQAERLMLITSGAEKQHIINYVTSPENHKIKYPVQLINNDNLIWFLSMI